MSKKFTPPLFGNFAKNVKDLFKKKYDFDHSVKIINKAANGVTIESGATVVASDNSLKGYLKGKYAATEFGETEAELWTNESNESKATVKLTKLLEGANLTLGGSSKDKDGDFKGPVASADFQYTQENLAVQDVLKTDGNVHKLESTVALGKDGLSAAAQVVLQLNGGIQQKDFNFAFQYEQKDLTASIYSEKQAAVINAALYQKPNASQVIGAVFKYNTKSKDRSLQLGAEHRIDADTTVRGKFELPENTFSAVVEHKLANPSVLLQVAATFANKGTLSAQKLGVTASFGDF